MVLSKVGKDMMHNQTFSRSIVSAVLGAAALVFAVSETAEAGTLGIEIEDSGSWQTNNSNNWTLGFEFSLSSTQEVSGLGFWDQDGIFGNTTVGLWQGDGTLIGTVETGSSTVRTEAVSGGPGGSWYFMDFAATLLSGVYVVGSWGESGMNYAFGGDVTENVLTFLDSREQSGGIFQFPTDELFSGQSGYGFFGANIEFGPSTPPVPVPASLPLLLAGVGGLAWMRRRQG